MKLVIAVIAAISLLEGAVHAAPLEECDVPQSFLESDTDLTRVTKEDQDRHRLDISVIGTGSSALSGPDGVRFAYPARLEDALKQRLKGVDIKVTAHTQSRETTANMALGLRKILDRRQTDIGDLAGRHGRCAQRHRTGGFPLQPRRRRRHNSGRGRRCHSDEHAIQPAHRIHARRFDLRRRDEMGCAAARRAVVRPSGDHAFLERCTVPSISIPLPRSMIWRDVFTTASAGPWRR